MFNGILFQQSLQDLVKGIRAHRRDEEEYVRAKVAEIGEECRSSDLAKKTTAVLKLSHLQMMGHNIGFASFHIVEVMSSPDFASKRIGYLAAAQSFSPTTDVLLLTTNQFKKDLTNGKLQDCSQALTCLGKLVTEELGRDLEHDVSLLLNSPRPYIRKKALLVLYRLIMVHPDTLPVVSARFRERLTDSDPGVVCAAVTVTCELARASPKSFLSLAPVLYQLLMSKESNNWMLIKIVKLMGVLTPLEPRLGKKLVEPLTALMRATRAKSLLYECCSTVTAGLMAHPEAVELCAQRLGEFMDDSDQNLKYLGLLSMRKLIQAHPQLALENRDNILDCLDDEDIGIRMRALELVSEFITKRTLRDISRILLRKLRKASADSFVGAAALTNDAVGGGNGFLNSSYSSVADQEAPYRESLARELLRAGKFKRPTNGDKGGYEMLTTGDDFAWYATSILGGLAEVPLLSAEIRDVIGDQLLEMTSRVEALRKISLKAALSLLSMRVSRKEGKPGSPLANASDENSETTGENGAEKRPNADSVPGTNEDPIRESKVADSTSQDAVLSASLAGNTAWILGEYSELIEDHVEAADVLTSFPRRALDSASQTRILTACVKVYASCPDSSAEKICETVTNYVEGLTDSQFAEVQERASFFKTLLHDFNSMGRGVLAPLFDGKLIPVDHRAQSQVPISDDLDLETSLLDTGSDSLYTYLLKTIGAVEDDDGAGDEEGDLFREAIFSNNPLSLSDNQPSSSNAYGPQSTLLGNLPQAGNKDTNPFYLNASSSGGNQSRVSAVTADDHDRPDYKYEIGQLSSEAAVVIAEDNPLGLDIKDHDQPGHSLDIPVTDRRLEEAFEGAFDAPGTTQGPRKQGRKKKKKRKDGKSRKSRGESTKADQAVASLIDFDAGPSRGNGEIASAPTSKPKHLADVLLM